MYDHHALERMSRLGELGLLDVQDCSDGLSDHARGGKVRWEAFMARHVHERSEVMYRTLDVLIDKVIVREKLNNAKGINGDLAQALTGALKEHFEGLYCKSPEFTLNLTFIRGIASWHIKVAFACEQMGLSVRYQRK